MLKNLIGWNTNVHAAPASACGAGDPKPSACGAADPKPTACGSTCGAGDKK
ncbi:MAG: ACGX-repeat peptide [Oscillospiraceae bacterium]|nr:ACGX-repeat peptide [Oscillospiraceae bacterium]